MKAGDFDSVVGIDERVTGNSRLDYYKLKFEKFVQSRDYIPTSLVAEAEDERVIGFVMGEVFVGEYGLSETATLDTIGVDPSYRDKGIGRQLIKEFMDHLKTLGIRKVNTLVDKNDSELMGFFNKNQFKPSNTVYLARDI
jgi:ribosomal protein S18 acetylase RimI-like enzyme